MYLSYDNPDYDRNEIISTDSKEAEDPEIILRVWW